LRPVGIKPGLFPNEDRPEKVVFFKFALFNIIAIQGEKFKGPSLRAFGKGKYGPENMSSMKFIFRRMNVKRPKAKFYLISVITLLHLPVKREKTAISFAFFCLSPEKGKDFFVICICAYKGKEVKGSSRRILFIPDNRIKNIPRNYLVITFIRKERTKGKQFVFRARGVRKQRPQRINLSFFMPDLIAKKGGSVYISVSRKGGGKQKAYQGKNFF
jgi:hypothetical protein